MRSTKNAHPLSFIILLVVIVCVAIGLAGSGRAGAAANPKAPGNLPDMILPGDSTVAPAAGTQENPQIVAGGGGYLAVWEDSRTDYAGIPENMLPSGGEVGGQTIKDIYAARLDANGNLIDTTPIVVNQSSWSQTMPQVAWNGQNWLVVWSTSRAVNFSSTKDVMAARVSPQGVVLDSPAIVIDNNPTIDEMNPTVASDGNNWLVMWLDQGAYYELDATRVGPNGAILDPGGVAVYTPGFPEAPYNFSLAFAGDEYLLVFLGDNDIKGLRLSPTLQHIGSAFQVSNAGNFPDVTTNGTDFFAAWMFNSGVHAARISHAGVVLDPAGLDLTGTNGGYPMPDVSWDGTNWLATWASGQNKTILSRVSTSGQILDPNGIVVSNSNYNSAAVVGKTGGGAQVVWTDVSLAGLGSMDIFGASVSVSGTPGAPHPIAQGAARQLGPDLAPNGTGYLAVFQSAVSGETRIKGQRLNADGTPIDSEPFLIAGGSNTFGVPRVAWNGTLYLVVWEDSSLSRGFVPGAILGKRVAANGTVLDATPFEITPGNGPDVAALNGDFLVVDTFEPVNHQRTPRAGRVASDGSVISSNVVIGSGYARAIKVETLGNRWLAIWEDYPTHDNPRSDASATFINADGTPVGEFTVADAGLDPVRGPSIAVGNNQALLTYYAGIGADVSQGDLYARRIQADGTLLDSNPGIQVTTANLAQFMPSAAWTGSEYLVAYEDYRNVPYLDRPVSDLYATRIDSNGTVLDPNGFIIANSFVPEVNAIVASNPGLGSYLLGFANFKFGAPYASYRVDIRHGQAGQPPAPEPSATPTNTPLPTAPVCIPDNYVIAEATAVAIVPGTSDSGNHCDECATEITLPFAFSLYDQTYTTVEATANGTLNFVYSGNTGGVNFCLPYSGLGYSILPYWHDMMTVGAGDGIFTSVSGSAPNRIFNIEWRACSFGGANCGSEHYNFEARLYEGISKFEIIYGAIPGSAYTTVGVQKDTGQRYTTYLCHMDATTGGLEQGLKLTFTMNQCGSATPIPTFPTSTPGLPVPTNTAVAPSATATRTATRVASNTPVAGATNTPQPSATNTHVPGATNTPAATATNTPIPAATNTSIPGATNTSIPAATNTPVPGATDTPAPQPSATPTTIAVEFSDVLPGSTFYAYVQCLVQRGVLGGYPDGTFRPNDGVTRGQLSKIVANAAGWSEAVSGQTFTDVAPDSTFYVYIERMASRGVIGGYPDGTFRPANPATRGQISKIVAKAYGYENPMSSQTFEDVAPTSTFYLWVENLAVRSIMNGYSCGGPGEPCEPGSKSYFRPANNATRGQIAKIVSNTFFPECRP